MAKITKEEAARIAQEGQEKIARIKADAAAKADAMREKIKADYEKTKAAGQKISGAGKDISSLGGKITGTFFKMTFALIFLFILWAIW